MSDGFKNRLSENKSEKPDLYITIKSSATKVTDPLLLSKQDQGRYWFLWYLKCHNKLIINHKQSIPILVLDTGKPR